MCASAEKTTELINNYLRDKNLLLDNPCWEIRQSSLGDRGVFATRNIEPGELIFVDCPIIIGPRVRKDSPEICAVCNKYDQIRCCAKNCGLPVCSDFCQESPMHQNECQLINRWRNGTKFDEITPELIQCLVPIRSLCLSDKYKRLVYILKSHIGPKHGFEVDILKNKLMLALSEPEDIFMRLVCSILDSNAFEVLVGDDDRQFSLKGLYTLGSLVNHNCSPNSVHVFDSKQRMVVRAAVFIPKNSEIFHCYTRLIWSTLTRRHHLLLTKHFCCSCERCRDPTEFGAYLNALKCSSCSKGRVLPVDPLKSKTKWECSGCKVAVENKKVGFVNSVLGQRLQSFEDNRDVDAMIEFWKQKLSSLVHETNHIVVELKYKLVWIIGYQDGYLWQDLSTEHLQIKEEICHDLLNLLLKLRTGTCKMRGLLLYELYCCLREKERRLMTEEINNNNLVVSEKEKNKMDQILQESSHILMYDVGAPAEIKNKWNETIRQEIYK